MPARPPKSAGIPAPHRRTQARRAGGTRISLCGAARLPHALAPRKRPAQQRARTTVEAILGAAIELFAARGYARTTTNAVAARAGISVGSLYQYFPNKDAILTALVERHMEAVVRIARVACATARNDQAGSHRSANRDGQGHHDVPGRVTARAAAAAPAIVAALLYGAVTRCRGGRSTDRDRSLFGRRTALAPAGPSIPARRDLRFTVRH